MVPFLITLVILAALLEWISLRATIDRVSYDSRASRLSVDPGEAFEIISEVENLSRLPISFVELKERLPSEMQLLEDNTDSSVVTSRIGTSAYEFLRLTCTLFLPPKRRVRRLIPVSLPRRGRYMLGGAVLTCGDLLGLRSTSRDFSGSGEIIVLPAKADDSSQILALGGFLGDESVRRYIMEDPVLTLGFREYTGREPQKAISWPQSVRAGRIMVREYDHTVEHTATIVLDVDSGAPELIERCFCLARSACESLEARRIQYSFITNASAGSALGYWTSIPDGLGRSHLIAILEGLGRASVSSVESAQHTLEKAAMRAEQGRSHIVITPEVTDAVTSGVRRLESLTGAGVFVMTAADPQPQCG